MSASTNSTPVNEQVLQDFKLLDAVNDRYGGVVVEGKKGVWIKLPIQYANLVDPAVEVLVVQENTGRFRGTGVWKFPTGVVDEGEDICVAAVREVKEEMAETEIEAAKWMPFEEYASQPFVRKHELLKYVVDYSGFSPVPTSSAFSDENNYMYFNTRDLEGQ
ncbi:Nudix hydrolase, putative isoform 2 [Hibiscus syriacus]|uniref:Nudix hydrolase, putative isoform 2 n=1 Tax=Hibiscus syriacus TaxID=106335 RepID=A0A6A3C5A4_HIBSY|nr:Nudix hydrolase, putative isoform 2 [Hibiscus syriacus]